MTSETTTEASDTAWFVILDDTAYSRQATIVEVSLSDGWSSTNEDGWTYQDLTGPTGEIWDTCSSREEAVISANAIPGLTWRVD